MISFSTVNSAQIRATKAKSPNFQSRNNTQTNAMSNDMFVKNSQVNLNKTASIKRLQPVKPLKTTSFGSGPMMGMYDHILMNRLMEAQQKLMSRVAGASEHSGLEEILGQNPHIDKKAWAKEHLDVARAHLDFGKEDAFSRINAYIFALRATELDEGNQEVHHFIKNDLGVPLHRAFDEKIDALLNGTELTDQDAHLAVLSEDEAKKFKKFHDATCQIRDDFMQIGENRKMAEILGEEPQMDQKSLAKHFFEAAQAVSELSPSSFSAKANPYGLASMSANMDKNNPAVHYFLASKVGVHPQEALQHVTEAVKQKPYDLDYLKLKIGIHAKLSQHDEVLSTAERAISLAPKDVSLRLFHGSASQLMGKLDAAASDYKKIAELDPQNLPSRSRLGTIEMDRGNQFEAIRWYDETEKAYNSIDAAKRGSGQVGILLGACNNRGLIYMNLGVFDKAEESFAKAIEADPKQPDARMNRAVLSFYKGDYSESIKDLDVAIKNTDPEEQSDQYVAASAMKALSLVHLGREDESADVIKKI